MRILIWSAACCCSCSGFITGWCPRPERPPLAKLQGWLHIAGGILFPAGVALVLLKGPSVEAAPIAGALIVVAAMLLFAVIVFRTARATT
jgi:hypothetical protein